MFVTPTTHTHEATMASKIELQDQALKLDVPIYGKGNKELSARKLKSDIKVRLADLATAHAAEQKAREEARATPKPDADGADDKVDPPVPDKPAPDKPVPALVKSRITGVVKEPDPAKVAHMGLKPPSDADRELAREHGYPVAIPDGKAFRTSISFNCVLGGGLRPMNSVVILTAQQVQQKAEYLTPV